MDQTDDRNFLGKLLGGHYGLAVTYWWLYFAGVSVFFVLASQAVDRGDWLRFLLVVSVMLGYTGLLLMGIRAAYKGPQMWKVMSRTSSVFMIINILVGIGALGFIY